MIKANALRYIRHIKTTGAIAGSSKYVIQHLTSNIDIRNQQLIVEFGAGTGNVTEQILKKMHPDSKLYCFEIDKDFIHDLEKITDKRFFLIKDSALNILEFVQSQTADVIISTLPLTFFKHEERRKFLTDCCQVMKPDGVFRQFLYTFKKRLFKNVFNEVDIKLSLGNLPPAFVYSCSNQMKR